MGRISQLLGASLAILATAGASSVVDLNEANFDSIVHKSGKPTLVEFFAPWCGHCKTLAPIYEDLAAHYEFAKDKVTIAKFDADAEKKTPQKHGIKGFPTLKWFNGKSQEAEDGPNGRDLASLLQFVQDKTGVKPKRKIVPPSAVLMLNDTSFKQEVGGNKDVLVAYTAQWCSHCKALAPIWEKVAHDFSPELDVVIGKVDCEAPNSEKIAEEADVESYPTIKLYPKGSTTPVPYEGERAHKEIVTFINQKTGKHRTPGGGLDAVAGTIASLDEIVATLQTGGEEAYKNLEKAADALHNKYAEYYAKVAKKAEANQGYVDKELARLRGLLEKGGLVREKKDDLTTRFNILNKFKSFASSVKDEL